MSDQTQIAGTQTTGSQSGTQPPQDDLNLNFDFGSIPDANVSTPQEEAPLAQPENNLDLNLDFDIPAAPVEITNVNENIETNTQTNEEPAVETQDFVSTEQNKESYNLTLDLPEDNSNETTVETPLMGSDTDMASNENTTSDESETEKIDAVETPLMAPDQDITSNEEPPVETQNFASTEQNKESDSLVLDLPEVNTEKKDDTRLETKPESESTLDISAFPTQTPEQVLSQYPETKATVETTIAEPAVQNSYFNIDSLQIDGSTPANISTPVQVMPDMPTIAQAMAPQQPTVQTETVVQQAMPAPAMAPQPSQGFNLDAIIGGQTMQTAMPPMTQPIQTVMQTSNPENILEQQLNKVYQPQQAPVAKSDKLKGVKIFVLAILMLGLGGYIANKMYPIEVQNLLSKVGIGGDTMQTNVQSIPDTTIQTVDTGIDTGISENTGNIQDTGTSVIPKDTSSTQILGEVNSGDTGATEDAINYNPFETNQSGGDTTPGDQGDAKSKLEKIRDDAQGFVELGTRVKNTKIKAIGLTVNKKAISLLQGVESGTNIDSITTQEEISKLETTLDKLRVIVNEIPTLTGSDTVPATSGGQIKEITSGGTAE